MHCVAFPVVADAVVDEFGGLMSPVVHEFVVGGSWAVFVASMTSDKSCMGSSA